MSNVSSSNSQGVRVPKLRFPGFEGEWESQKLSDFAVRVMRKNSNNETELPLTISSKDGLVDQITYFNKTVASKDMSGYYLLKNGEFAYNKSYSVGYDFGSVKRLDRYPIGALSTLYICFSLTKHNSDFIKVYFDSLKWYKEIYMIAAEGARNHGLLNVPTEDFFETKHTLPKDIKEQQKIAQFMLLIEKRIEKQRQLVEALKSYKRGLSEALFSGKIGRWDLSNIPCGKYKLGELGYFYNGLSGKNKNDFGKGTSQYISYMNVYKNLIADEHILENVIVSATEKQNSVKYGDVLFTQSSETLNEVGYTSVWLSKSTPFLNSFCFGFRFYEQEQTDPYFIAHYFRSSTIRKSIMREGQGATRVNLSSERLKDMVILLPPVHIQKEIGKILNHLEQQIEINAHIEIQLSIYKSRLLQQLFI